MKNIGYHGTTNSNVSSILIDNFKISKQNNKELWLGKGAYFFIEDIYAFKWCLHEYKRIYNKEYEEIDFKKKMGIIEAELLLQKNKILDLTLFEGQRLFDYTYKEMNDNKEILDEEYAQFLNIPKYASCMVINYMFDILDFNLIYDAVKQLYRQNTYNYNNILDNREKGLPQYQICIKNQQVIGDKKIFDYHNKIQDYCKYWNDLIGSKKLIPIYGNKNITKKINMYRVQENNSEYI